MFSSEGRACAQMSLYVPGTAILLLCVGPLARWGTQLGGGCRPPQVQCGTGHRCAHPTSRPEGWSSVWRTREGERGLLWMGVGAEVSTATPGGGGPEGTPPPFRLLPPSVPIAESSWIQKARGGSGSSRQPHPHPPGHRAGWRVDLEGKWKFPALDSFPVDAITHYTNPVA